MTEVFRSCVHHWTDVYLDGNMGRVVRVSHRTVRMRRVDLDVNEHRSAFAAGLNNGGASGLLYGYLLAWSGTALQVLIMAELGSMCVEPADVRLD